MVKKVYILFILFCACSLSLNAHDGEEHEVEEVATLTASSLDGVWKVGRSGVCTTEDNDLKLHATHELHQAKKKLVLHFCSEDDQLFGLVKNRNRLHNAEAEYQVIGSTIENGSFVTTFNITAQAENGAELNFDLTAVDPKKEKRITAHFQDDSCGAFTKRIKAKPSRACKRLLPVNSIAE